jgi:sirohydrochlorin cobaltochelatase
VSEEARPAPRRDAVDDWLQTMPCRIGEILIARRSAGEFGLCHRDEAERADLASYDDVEAAIEIARFDDGGVYRPLKTAPNLRHGWILLLGSLPEVRRAIDYFYPARLAAYAAWHDGRLLAIPLRETLNRQTGIYRVAANIADDQANALVAGFCRSAGGCLRTIQWKRDTSGAPASTLLPAEKFDPAFDQTGGGERTLPLLCQEACNLLVAEARKVVKAGEA